MSKKELEEQRKKEQEEAAAQVGYKKWNIKNYRSLHVSDFFFAFSSMARGMESTSNVGAFLWQEFI
jgi:hypothetical protein